MLWYIKHIYACESNNIHANIDQWYFTIDTSSVTNRTSNRLQEPLEEFLHSSESMVVAIALACSLTDVQIYLIFSGMVRLRETWLHNPNGTNKVFSFIENLSRDAWSCPLKHNKQYLNWAWNRHVMSLTWKLEFESYFES